MIEVLEIRPGASLRGWSRRDPSKRVGEYPVLALGGRHPRSEVEFVVRISGRLYIVNDSDLLSISVWRYRSRRDRNV